MKDDPDSTHAQLSRLPQLGALLEGPEAARLLADHPRELVKEALRRALGETREAILARAVDESPAAEALVARAAALLAEDLAPRLRRVINATGVALHTGLGRAPLAPEALDALRATAMGYCNLEVRLEEGVRGRREDIIADLIARITGAEAGLAVNNNAAAVTLILRELAAGRQVIVSRGQLVEIGGSFRLPEIMAQSGCELVEVGTTNITRARDYEAALGPETAALLVAHHSNYRIVGFHEEPALGALADLARRHDLPLLHDLGSGALVDVSRWGLEHEPTVQDSLAAGVDLVCFSGDKLLGGPQAGIIAGRRELVARVRANPLARAFRVDKLCLAALEATLRLYLDPEGVARHVPVLRTITAPLEEVRQRALRAYESLRAALPAGTMARIEEDTARVGGGSLPEADVPTATVRLWPQEGDGVDDLARRLRVGRPSVYPRIAEDALVLDLRTVRDDEVEELVAAVAAAFGAE